MIVHQSFFSTNSPLIKISLKKSSIFGQELAGQLLEVCLLFLFKSAIPSTI